MLSVVYTGRLIDGTIFDTNTASGRSEFVFTLGAGSVIQGFDLRLTGASLGDIYHLEIPSTLGYGSRASASIPANSTLLFDVEIRGISRGSSQLTYKNEIGNTVDTFTLKKDSTPVNSGTLGSEWIILAADRINESNQVLWKNKVTNKLLVWTLDSNWNWSSSGALIDPSSGAGKEVESQFGIDINGDGSVYVYKMGTTLSSVDVISGSSSDEFFAPLGVGATGLDRIILGGGKNQIQLQGSSGANLYGNSKESDFLVVEDFNTITDQLLLAATQTYGSFPVTLGSHAGLAIYEDKNGDKLYKAIDDEVLVWLKGVTTMPAISFGAATFAVSGNAQIGEVLTVAKTADDPDGNGSGAFSYTWQSTFNGTTWGNVGTNSASYTIVADDEGKQLRLLASYTDAQGFSESVTTSVGFIPYVNDASIDLTLTTGGIQENSVAGSVIGTLSAIDPDAGSSFSYALVAGNGTNDVDNGLVDIAGIEVRVKSGALIDFETNPVLNLNIRVTDNGNPGLTFTKAVSTPVLNVNEALNVLKVKDSTGNEVADVSSERKTSTLSQLTSTVPLKAESSKLLERYKINDSTSTIPKKASDIDSTFIDFTIKTGALKSLTAEIALEKEVKANAYAKVNPNTGEAFDFTYDPITGLGAQLLDNNKNGLVDTLKIHLQDGAKGDIDGLVNGEIRDPGVLADAPRQSVYRFFKASKGVHLYTSSDAERANVNANPEWGYKDEGVVYDALVTQGKALHRFFNAKASYHFMTTNDEEAKTVKANPAWGFSYEGESFSVSTIPQLGMSTPVNRFYRVLDGVGQHFYTASSAEASNINAHPEWGYKSEGVGWYV